MIKVKGVYEDVALDNANKDENGNLSYVMFNRLSRRAELRLMDYLTGHVTGQVPPIPYLTQKNKDYLFPFIVKLPKHVQGGVLEVPEDYYTHENLSAISGKECSESDRKAPSLTCNTPVEVLDGQQFNGRCKSHIKALRPSKSKPLVKQVGKNYEFAPKDIGDVVLEYIRYPKFANVKTKLDPIYQDEIVDELSSLDYEWGENAREALVWIITDLFATHNREQALKQANLQTAKSEGDRR